jgi:enoyl-CoA hydratase/carnithine racemase
MDWSSYDGKHAFVDRDAAGVVTVRLHSDGGTCVWGARPHTEITDLFGLIGQDRQARVVVVTGTGEEFLHLPEGGAEQIARGTVPARAWDRVIREGNRLISSLLDVEVPMIAAVNGPAVVHSEIALLCDIVIASDTAVFADAAHFPSGLVPGDGMQVIWPLLLGPNAGRYLLLTGQQLSARRAHELGVVGEVLRPSEVLPRALEIAGRLATQNPTLLRSTRQVLTRPLKRAMADDLPLGLALEAFTSLSGAEWFNDERP